jgi:hypothetical protein
LDTSASPKCPDIPGTTKVGGGGIAAIGRGERLLAFTTGLVDRPTPRTGSPRVIGSDGNNRDAARRRLIGHEPAKLSKGPPVQTVALCPCGVNVLANVRQIFDRNRKAGAFGGSNSLLAKAVVGVLSQARLLCAELLHTPLGGFAATPLQTGATKGEFPTGTLDIGARTGAPRRVVADVDDAEIHAEDILDAYPRGARALAADEGKLHSASERRDAHRVVGNEADDAIIVGLGGVQESGETAVGLPRHGGDAPNGLSRKPELFPQLVVDKFLQGILARCARLEIALRNRVAGGIAAFERIAGRLRLLCRRRQLDVRNEFYTRKSKMIGGALQRRSAFLSRVNSGACSAEVL